MSVCVGFATPSPQSVEVSPSSRRQEEISMQARRGLMRRATRVAVAGAPGNAIPSGLMPGSLPPRFGEAKGLRYHRSDSPIVSPEEILDEEGRPERGPAAPGLAPVRHRL